MSRQEQRTAATDWRATKTLPVPPPRVDLTPERVLNIAIVIIAIVSALVCATSAIDWVVSVVHRVSP